ncbi:hypothetical protein ACFT9M_03245 [Micromonospora purpureochromogenes]|uniref:hypothetical protein n=1 Tax=Micromonospora purpureochromogenes TaxID=47872 RepID=UPI003633C647
MAANEGFADHRAGHCPPGGTRTASIRCSLPTRSSRMTTHDRREHDATTTPTESFNGFRPVDDRSNQLLLPDRHTVVSREKQRYGGIKWGSAFFGWLTATGTAVILTALLAGAGTAVGVATDTSTDEATGTATGQAQTVGIVGGVALLVVLLLAYYCGGYVAGRMARFNGARQGIAVWLWAVVIAVIVAIVGALLGSKFDVLARLDGFPRIPINEGDVTTTGLLAALVAAAASLIGAVLGGLAGMRFHRKVDKAGLGH